MKHKLYVAHCLLTSHVSTTTLSCSEVLQMTGFMSCSNPVLNIICPKTKSHNKNGPKKSIGGENNEPLLAVNVSADVSLPNRLMPFQKKKKVESSEDTTSLYDSSEAEVETNTSTSTSDEVSSSAPVVPAEESDDSIPSRAEPLQLPELSKYTLDFSQMLERLLLHRYGQTGGARRRECPADISALSEAQKNSYLVRSVGKRINWPTWIRINDGDLRKALMTLLLHQFSDTVPRSVRSTVNMSLFTVSKRGYHDQLRNYIVGLFGIDVDQIEKFTFATVRRWRELLEWYVTLLVDLKLIKLPENRVLSISIFADANSKTAKIKVNGYYFHLLDCPDCAAVHTYLPFLFQIGADYRTGIEAMLASRTRSKPAMREVPGAFRWLRTVNSDLGKRLSFISSINVNGVLYSVRFGACADYHALLSFFTLADLPNSHHAATWPARKHTGRRDKSGNPTLSVSYKAGLDAPYFCKSGCPVCNCSSQEIFSLRTTFPRSADPPSTVFDGMNPILIMEGMLHAIPSVFGLCRDLLVVCNFIETDNGVSAAFDSFDFGVGWDWRFGLDDKGMPMDPDTVTALQRDFAEKKKTEKPKELQPRGLGGGRVKKGPHPRDGASISARVQQDPRIFRHWAR